MQGDHFYQKCLRNELELRLQKNPRYSLRAFAKSLQIDPTALSKIINGTKIPSPQLSKKILNQLSLSPVEERNFLFSMAKAYDGSGAIRKKPEVHALLKQPHTRFPVRDLSLDVFRIISDWYHLAILQIVQCKEIESTPKWIAQQLGIQEMEAKIAIQRLRKLGLLKLEKGKLIRTAERLTTGDVAITAPALKKRIKQVAEKAVHSLENDPIEERSHTAITMAIDPDKISIAKKRIQTFMNELADELQTDKKRVYELQVSLFPLQRSPK